MSRIAPGISCALLLLAVVGAAVAISGVDSGWAFGAAHDLRPQAGGWGPYGPAGDIIVDMGWWNVSTVIKASGTDIAVKDMAESARTLGVCMVVVYIITSGLAVYFSYLITAQALGAQVDLLAEGLFADKTIALMMRSTAISGTTILLVAAVMYISLAIGAHRTIQQKSDEYGQDISIWPHPSWAFFAAVVAGISQLVAARIFSGALAEAPYGYSGVSREHI